MTNDPKHDHDPHDEHDNDNGDHAPEKNVAAPAPAGGALVSLAALGQVLNGVDTASVIGHSGMPMLSFKRDGNGTWMFGQKRTVVEDGSLWGANPLTFKWGYICFGDSNKVLGERLVSVSLPMPDPTELPDKGFPWSQQWAVNLKCLSGTDAGIEVVYKPTTVGGKQAVAGLIEAVRDRLNGGQHDGAVAPILRLEKDSYQRQHGPVWTPIMAIIDWMSIGGPAPAPEPAAPPPQPAEQPRRRRVG